MEPAPELQTIIAGWFEAVANGDTTWVDRYVSRRPETRLIGTDPSEWLAGEQVAAFLQGEIEAMAGTVQVTPGEPEAFRAGSVGWGHTRATLTLPDGRQVTPRWSAVFHQEDEGWKLVYLHASVGIANEERLGMELSG